MPYGTKVIIFVNIAELISTAFMTFTLVNLFNELPFTPYSKHLIFDGANDEYLFIPRQYKKTWFCYIFKEIFRVFPCKCLVFKPFSNVIFLTVIFYSFLHILLYSIIAVIFFVNYTLFFTFYVIFLCNEINIFLQHNSSYFYCIIFFYIYTKKHENLP